ncbi:MAG: hypothetical protein ACE5I2_15405, partial [Anaerolineae bacterium]
FLLLSFLNDFPSHQIDQILDSPDNVIRGKEQDDGVQEVGKNIWDREKLDSNIEGKQKIKGPTDSIDCLYEQIIKLCSSFRRPFFDFLDDREFEDPQKKSCSDERHSSKQIVFY